jgi:hypothetical protein
MSNPGTHNYHGKMTSRGQRTASKLGYAITVERMEAVLGERPALDEAKVLPPQRPEGYKATLETLEQDHAPAMAEHQAKRQQRADGLAAGARLNAPLGLVPSMVANEDPESSLELTPAGQPRGGS